MCTTCIKLASLGIGELEVTPAQQSKMWNTSFLTIHLGQGSLYMKLWSNVFCCMWPGTELQLSNKGGR